MSRGGDLTDIKALLQAQILSLCKELVPQGHRSGNYWMARNPTRNDRHPGSFWVAISGGAAGAWRDEATDEKGDVLQLIAYVHGWERKDYKQILTWARGWLGLADMPEEKKRERIAQARAAEEREARLEAQRLRDKRRSAMGLWAYRCQKSLLGTVAQTYLAGRGIDLTALPRQPGALRFSPAQKHVESGQSFPAIVAAMVGIDPTVPGNKQQSIVAIHRTFLAPDGSGKAPVTPARKIWPRFSGTGAAVHLWRGETGVSHIQAEKDGLWDRMAIVEGIEDGLAVALACPELRVWCAGTLGNIAEIRLPACCGEVIVCADNDWGKPDAQRLLERGLTALARQGRRSIKVARSPVGKDVNDALRAGL